MGTPHKRLEVTQREQAKNQIKFEVNHASF